jgi:hypothetical protein
MPRKHTMPPFLNGVVRPEKYESWLGRKAAAHVKRERARQRMASASVYKEAIHAAVVLSEGKDAYTGEFLDWPRIGTYDNDESKAGRHGYKAQHALLPTIDHLDAGATEASFRVCAWRTNDAKNDLSIKSFLELCQRVLEHAGFSVTQPTSASGSGLDLLPDARA